jgi:hypothetical protein
MRTLISVMALMFVAPVYAAGIGHAPAVSTSNHGASAPGVSEGEGATGANGHTTTGAVSVSEGIGNPSASSFGLSNVSGSGRSVAPAAAGTAAVGLNGMGAAAAYGAGVTASGATTSP